MQMVEKK